MFRKTIPDESWSRLAPVLHSMGMHGIGDLRDRLEAMLWRMRTGSPCRDLPSELGSWSTNFNFFNRWSKRGVWQKVFESLRGELDDEWNFIDSTAVKAHADAHGNLVEVLPTGGNVSDFTPAPALIENCHAEYLIADKGYDSNKVRDTANARGICDQIPTRSGTTRSNRHFDVDLYRLRHLVENFFCRIKRHRAIATRYDKLARNFLSFVYLAATLEALK